MQDDVFLVVDGKKYEGFNSLNYFKSLEDLSGSFSFSATTEKKRFTPFKGQEKAEIFINDVPIITGFTESITYSYSNGSHIINIAGRDKTADIIDNSIIGQANFKAPLSLKNLIKDVLRSASLDIEVIDKVGDIPLFEQNEFADAEVGENMFEFIEKYCRKRSVLITSNGEGNLVISRAADDLLDGILINRIKNNNNNVKEANINYDFSNRYNKYICHSQGNPSIIGILGTEGLGASNIESTLGQAIDDEIRASRQLEFFNETSSVNESNTDRATWEANIRRARSMIYTCTTNHLFVDKENKVFYTPNKLIRVDDDFCDIDATLLIRSVNYELTQESGTNIILELVLRDAYTPQASRKKVDAKYDKVGESVEDKEVAISNSTASSLFVQSTQGGAS